MMRNAAAQIHHTAPILTNAVNTAANTANKSMKFGVITNNSAQMSVTAAQKELKPANVHQENFTQTPPATLLKNAVMDTGVLITAWRLRLDVVNIKERFGLMTTAAQLDLMPT